MILLKFLDYQPYICGTMYMAQEVVEVVRPIIYPLLLLTTPLKNSSHYVELGRRRWGRRNWWNWNWEWGRRWGEEEVGAEELVELGVGQRRTGGTRSEERRGVEAEVEAEEEVGGKSGTSGTRSGTGPSGDLLVLDLLTLDLED
jgi:hypothetical protein